ncbi:MAG: cytochrome P450 [Monoraphidium minutum]|nr:MAG: cytochrome P450 [Monoraphidium minutum]
MPAVVVPGTGDMARAVLGREGDLSGPASFFTLGELVDFDAISFQREPQHRAFREMMRPSFDASVIGGKFLPEIAAIVAHTLEGAAAAGGVVPGYTTMKRMTFEIIMNVMMGKAYAGKELDRMHTLYMDYTSGMMTWPQLELLFSPYRRAMAARRALLAVLNADIAAARSAAAAGRKVPGQLGVMVLGVDELGGRLDDRCIAETLLAFLFAGHDTTSTALTGLIAEIQGAPEVLARLRAEQAGLVAAHGPGVTPGGLKDMDYADAVIREFLRLRPVANEVFREAARDFEMGGALVKEGDVIAVPLGRLARRDPRWESEAPGSALDPAAFNPARMLTPEGRRPGDMMPFGHGGRHCLGVHLATAEMKAFLALWAQGYVIEADTATEWAYSVGRYPKNGLPLTVARL